MRADAVRRRDEILRQARILFAAEGSEVALEVVAEAAGVGIATLYRNFGSRSELVDAVARAVLQDMVEAADRALQEMGERPAEAWPRYVRRLVSLDLGALTAALAERANRDLSPQVRTAQERTLEGVEQVLAAARTAGEVRADLSALELVLVIGTVTRPQPAMLREAAPDLVSRASEILIAGMRDPSVRCES